MLDYRNLFILILLFLVILYQNFQNNTLTKLNNTQLNKVYKGIFLNRKFNIIIMIVIIIISSLFYIEYYDIDMADKKKKRNIVYSFSSLKELN